MVLYNSTLRALLLNYTYLYKGLVSKRRKFFDDLKAEVCESQGVSSDISDIDFIKVIGKIYGERGMSSQFYNFVRKHNMEVQVYATKVYSWDQVKELRHEKTGISEPHLYNWVYDPGTKKYYTYEKL